MPIPALAYRRVSSQHQATGGHSLDEDQPAVIARLAAAHGLAVVAEYTDVQSGTSHARPGLLAMLEHLERDRISAVVAAATDRITRGSPRERGTLQELLERQQVSVYATDGVYHLGARDSDSLTWEVRTAVSADFIRRLRSTLRASHESRRRRGVWAYSVAPYGYAKRYRSREQADATGVPLDLVPDAHASTVKRMFADFAGGSSLQSLAKTLTAEGVPPPAQAASGDSSDRAPFNVTAVRFILLNPTYAGLMVGEVDGEETTRELVNVEPIIDVEMWQRVHARIDAIRTIHPRRRNSDLLFVGLLVCGHCGATMWSKDPGTRKGKQRHLYYRCSARVTGQGCAGHKSIRQDRLLAQVWPYLRTRLQPVAQAQRAEERAAADESRSRRLAIVDRQLQMLLDLHLAEAETPGAGISAAEYQRRSGPLRAERERLTAQAPTAVTALAVPGDDVVGWLRSLSNAELKRVLQELVEQITVTDGKAMLPPIWR